MEEAVDSTASLTDNETFFFSIASSEESPERDLRKLKWEYSLPEVLKIQEYIEIRRAFQSASIKDEEARSPSRG